MEEKINKKSNIHYVFTPCLKCTFHEGRDQRNNHNLGRVLTYEMVPTFEGTLNTCKHKTTFKYFS